MKRFSMLLFTLLIAVALCGQAVAGSTKIKDDVTFSGQVTVKDKPLTYKEISAPSTTPATGDWYWYFTSGGLYVKDDQGAATQITAGAGDNTLDNAYDQGGAGAGRTITADTGAVTITNTDADAAYLLAVTPTPGSSAATGGVQITNGANSTQDSLNIVNSGSGDDIQAGNGAFTVSSTGAIVGVSADLSGALSADGAVALGNGTGTVAINSSSWDVSSAGAVTGISTVSLSGDITMATGQAVQSSTTTAETVAIQGYDVDNTTYRNAILVTNGNTIATAIGTGNETFAVNSTTWDVSTTGAFTGVADITGTAGEALGITLASDGAADDLTISVTGANDASVILSSAGTGEDANKISSSAGGVDIDAAAAKDVNIAGGQVQLVSKDDAASAITLTTNNGVSETIVATNTQGTADGAITLTATAGGIDVNATKSLTLTSAEVQADAVVLEATAGGLDITSAATYDIDLTATGGTIQAIASEAAANQFKVDAQGTVAGYAIVLETTNGGVQINSDGVENGDILIDAGDDLGLTAAGDLNYTVTGTVDYNASSLTDVRMDFENVAAANVLTSAECNKEFFLNDATEFQTTLETAAGQGGCVKRITVGAAPSGASYTVITGNSLENVIYGLIEVNGAAVACAAEDTITFADGAAVKGDYIELRNDDTSWYISGQAVGAGAITCTQAD